VMYPFSTMKRKSVGLPMIIGGNLKVSRSESPSTFLDVKIAVPSTCACPSQYGFIMESVNQMDLNVVTAEPGFAAHGPF
jgi:hypothetical protein